MKTMGIRMGGCEQPLEDLIKQHVVAQPVEDYTLIEVGSAGCTTLRAFREIMIESRPRKPWHVIGFDLTPDKAWSLNMQEVAAAFGGSPHILFKDDVDKISTARDMILVLLDDPRSYLRETFALPIDFAFIDGCHGKCAGLDFLAIENKVRPGGLVAFHDYGEFEQGSDYQEHCREFISVRSYVHRLGLAAPHPEPRKGWRFIAEIKGSRHWGADGNSIAVVQRTNEPLEVQPRLSID